MDALRAFVGLVAPQRMLGHCHHGMHPFFLEEQSHQLALWPCSHPKATMIAYDVSWEIIKDSSICLTIG